MTIQDIARAMMAPGKGILAADESESTMEKRFAPIGLEQNPENNRTYRDLLFTTEGLEDFLSGVILHDQTIRQSSETGEQFPKLLMNKGIIPGIKVDQGLVALEGTTEQVSTGLDGLGDRLSEYYELGARFTKWRSVIAIGDALPSTDAIEANADVLAEYAEVVQGKHMVPMVEPEVLFDGTHTLERCGEVLRETLGVLFGTLAIRGVAMDGLILKTSMALPGKDSGIELDPEAIARETVAALKDAVPEDVAGVVFLSGGQTPEQATNNLHAIAKLGTQPWPISFSYARAIEEPVIAAWAGDGAHAEAAQEVLRTVLRNNCQARGGTYRAV